MKETRKIVSVIVPTYNQARYLSQTLDSILGQTYKHWECIIVDDGSDDETEKISKKYCGRDPRFFYLFQSNQGPSVARNTGISCCKGEYILPLDSDDLISEDYLKDTIEIFIKHPETKLVYCMAAFFGEEEGLWPLPDYSYDKMLYENIIFCSAVYKKKDYYTTKGYNPEMRRGLEDWDFWLSLIKRNDLVYKIPKIHFFYRIKNESRNRSLRAGNKDFECLCQMVRSNHKELYNENTNNPYNQYLSKRKRINFWSRHLKSFPLVTTFSIKLRKIFNRLSESFRGK